METERSLQPEDISVKVKSNYTQSKFSKRTKDTEESSIDIKLLLRKIDQQIALKGQSATTQSAVDYSKMLSLATPQERFMMICGHVCAALTGFAIPIFSFLFGTALDTFGPCPDGDCTEQMDKIKNITIQFACIASGLWVVSYMYWAFLLNFSLRLSRRIKERYLEAILQQECAWFDQVNYTELSARISRETQLIERSLGEKAGSITLSIATGCSGLIVGLYKGWAVALCILAAAPFLLLVGFLLNTVLTRGSSHSLVAYAQSAGFAEQALSAIRVVSAFGMESVEAKNYIKYLDKAKKASMKTHLFTALATGLLLFVVYNSYAWAFYIGSVFIEKGIENSAQNRPYTGGDILSCFFGVIIGLFSLSSCSNHYKAIIEGKVAAKLAFDVIDRQPTIQQEAPQSEKHTLEGEIELKNINFYYPTRPDSKVLKNLCAKFEVGKTTAIVGPSGAGKSSIAQMIERFYDPNEGEVLVDGKPLTSLNLLHYRSQIGYVSQEPVLFNTSIKNNILMGKPKATDEEVERALRSTNAWDFVSKYPDGVNTFVGASGSQLSGGQKQRLALARAFIKKPKLLIFDEATSALDKKNEQEVQKAIDEMKAELTGVTCIVIAHRLSTIRNADKILVMKAGKVVEQGDHQYLLKHYPQGVYSKLVSDQEKIDQQTDKNNDAEQNQEKAATYLDDVGTAADLIIKEEAVEKMQQADILLNCKKMDLIEILDKYTNPKTQKSAFKQKLQQYNKPQTNIIVGFIFETIKGVMTAGFGAFIQLNVFAMLNNYADFVQMRKDVNFWCLIMFLSAILAFTCTFVSKSAFGVVGENITLSVRSDLYTEIMKKHIGWHDDSTNAAGVLSAVLASDVQLLNGASSEALAVISEAICSIVAGIIIGFAFCWKVALVALALTPFMMMGGSLAAKIQKENIVDNKSAKQADLLASDAIMNYRTVTGFGLKKMICKEYSTLIDGPFKASQRSAHISGIVYGYSQFITNVSFACLFYFGMRFLLYDTSLNGRSVFISIFAMFFGAYGAGQATTFGPDIGKATQAAIKIFKITDTPSQINPTDIPTNAIKIPKDFQGEIVFKDVWFRYPLRPKQWVFKGLNLTIKPKDCIAIVGESGQGKSTFILLLMRFYDVDFGQILIDGIDIRSYNIQQLRQRMGLVMQEPTLFNYSVKDNVLYGNQFASNKEILDSCEIANARVFIESPELEHAVEDNAHSLKIAMEDPKIKAKLVRKIGQESYELKLDVITNLDIKESKEGNFKPSENELDVRSESQKGFLKLHNGYSTQCGNRGSKLSGGQKQRIAIARAVVRQPHILLLDEATSALDEDSQKKVQAALENVMKGRTSIVIAHRMTTVEKCTRVAVIEDGVIVEEGSFTELQNKQDGYFSQLAAGMQKQKE